MGEGDMPDNNDVITHLEENGALVLHHDLSNVEKLRELPWNLIDVVDLRNMRGSLTNFDKYIGIVDRIYDKIAEQKNRGHQISTVPTYEAIKWIASKANYYRFLDVKNIPTIPTKIIRRHSLDTRPSITDPNMMDQAIQDTLSYIENSSKNKFVLKPSVSSLAKKLIFIERDTTGDFLVESPLESKPSDFYEYSSGKQIEDFLRQYFAMTPSPDECFLIQEYIENLETSAVFIGGKPHFVERTYGKARIAHKRYGGEDTILEDVEDDLHQFIAHVMNVLPEFVRSSPFLRIDVMWDQENKKYVLSEIEGAGAARLWLTQAQTGADYANILIRKALSSNSVKNPMASIDPSHPLLALPS